MICIFNKYRFLVLSVMAIVCQYNSYEKYHRTLLGISGIQI